MLQTDSYFHIGHDHLNKGQPCQDHALPGVCGNAVYAIVADGCSTGGHTDVGARIVTFATAQAICEHWNTTHNLEGEETSREIAARQKAVIAGARAMLGLVRNDLLATCAYAYVGPDNGFVHLQGDGVVAMKSRSSEIRMTRYDWADNMPLYPAYAGDGFQEFISAHGGDLGAIKLTSQHWLYEPENGFIEQGGEEFTLSQGIRGITIPLALEDLEYIAVFTDGVTQVEGVDWKDATLKLLAFKTTAGDFAKRRCIRFIKDSQRTGKGPLDDIAYAVIRIDQPETEESS